MCIHLAIRVKNHSIAEKTVRNVFVYLRHRKETNRKKNATKCCGLNEYLMRVYTLFFFSLLFSCFLTVELRSLFYWFSLFVLSFATIPAYVCVPHLFSLNLNYTLEEALLVNHFGSFNKENTRRREKKTHHVCTKNPQSEIATMAYVSISLFIIFLRRFLNRRELAFFLCIQVRNHKCGRIFFLLDLNSKYRILRMVEKRRETKTILILSSCQNVICGTILHFLSKFFG